MEEINEHIKDESHVYKKVINKVQGKARMKPVVLDSPWRYS